MSHNTYMYNDGLSRLRRLPPGTQDFVQAAIDWIDSYGGCSIRRPTEEAVLRRLPSKESLSPDPVVRHGYDIPVSRLFSADCHLVARLLNSKGEYMIPGVSNDEGDGKGAVWNITADPVSIKLDLARRGYTWVKEKHVIVAQRIKKNERD